MNDSAIAGSFLGLGIFGFLIVGLLSLFWIWMIIDCAMSARLDGTQKIVWLLVIFFLHFIGAVVYFAVGRNAVKT